MIIDSATFIYHSITLFKAVISQDHKYIFLIILHKFTCVPLPSIFYKTVTSLKNKMKSHLCLT